MCKSKTAVRISAITAFSCSMCSAIRAGGRGLGPALGAVECQADPEQLRDDMIVQVPGDPVPVGEHLQLPERGLRCGALQGQRGLVGEGGDQLQLVLAERRGRELRTASSTPARSSSAPSGIARAGPNSTPRPAATSNAKVTLRGMWSVNTAPDVEPVIGIRSPWIRSAFGPTLTTTVRSGLVRSVFLIRRGSAISV